jgi:phospholipase C
VFNTREEIMSLGIVNRNRWPRRAAVGTVFGAVLSCSFAVTDATADKDDVKTDTPIKHLIVLIGENHTFDNIFATYQPRPGQSVANLLSKGIIFSTGQPGLNFIKSQQYQINTPFPATYFIDATVTAGKTVPTHAHIPCTEYHLYPDRAGAAQPGPGTVRFNRRAGLVAADDRAVA